MNNEEKKAVELLENIKYESWTTKYIMSSDSKNAEILLNLIEKQQNRITELEKINAEHQKINGKLRDELNLLKKQKQDVLDFLELDCEGDYD